MADKPSSGTRIADNSGSWPSLAAYLAPSAGCECQVLALTIAEGIGTAKEADAPAKHQPEARH
jgi:hypothetical protein